MTLVVDANVALKWFVPQTDRLATLKVQSYAGRLIDPSMILPQVANGLWRHVRSGDISSVRANGAISALEKSFVEIVPDSQLTSPALTIAIALDHSPYDCIYLALAERENAKLVTADQAFFHKLFKKRRTKNIVLLHQWSP